MNTFYLLRDVEREKEMQFSRLASRKSVHVTNV